MATGADPSPPPAPPDDAATLPGGYRLNDYVVERPLGGGGFGITYLARDSNLQLPVAIKEYFPADLVTRGGDHTVKVRGGSPEQQEQYDWGLERFLDEARALATFRHPNIVRVLRYFRDNATAYIVMEYESGLSLKRWVPQNAPLSQRSLLSIIYPVLDGLEAVHKTGFLHRDIKPDNIYVRADGTPVLLDFGAARRVSANKDLTNIVSPGFAPFEQYHSQGNQGPWTDIYSLGAVMYWMTTGKKPVESAARVKLDSLVPASTLAEPKVFGAALLDAIVWAMNPDEGRRPQSVALFRSAIQGSEKPASSAAVAEAPADRQAITAAGHAPSIPGSAPTSPSAALRRNLLCTIMFLELAGHPGRSPVQQDDLKKLFGELVAKALKGVPEETRISIETSEGMAICFMGDPEEALHSAMLLRDLLGQRYGALLAIRVGLHMGPVRVISDVNERVNVVGDGINVAQRIMDFAQGNQVLVSRSYYEVISRITDHTADLFQYLGQYEDKHGRLHEVYSVLAPGRGDSPTATTARGGPSTGYTQTRPSHSGRALDPEEVNDVELELARNIGPLARILVRKAQPLAGSIQALRNTLAHSIQEPKAREAFIAGQNSLGRASQSQPSSRPPASQSSPSGPGRGNSAFGALGPSSRSQPVSVPMAGAGSRPMIDVPPEELAVIEQALGKYIGPMAKMLVRKELARRHSFREFIEAVADTIDQPAQREAFIQALKKSLPRRHK
ncbi:MAG TPA: protein kinase [Ramlibacter sp.]|nr:protein kinase [Ramlibacter sp.]